MNEPNYISGSSGSEANDMDNENDGWSLDSIEPNVPHVEVVNIPHPIRNQDDPPNLFHLLDDDSVSNPVSHNGVNDEDLVGYDNMLSVYFAFGLNVSGVPTLKNGCVNTTLPMTQKQLPTQLLKNMMPTVV